jgi:isopenicillin N synthase-like dioxygenase
MLFQDDCGGLEIEDPKTPGKFIPAEPVPGAMVLNVGDLLMRWSNGKKSDHFRGPIPDPRARFHE